MIENILVIFKEGLCEYPAKPHKTSCMPKISPYLISMSEENNGFIDRVSYFVIDKNTGSVWGHGYTKTDAIAHAKKLYGIHETKGTLDFHLERYSQQFTNIQKDAERQFQEFLDSKGIRTTKNEKTTYRTLEKKLPKRAMVFKKNDGKCFYCDDQLAIEDEWHIEHKHPKSKGGSNDIENLVPACPSCNLRKKDKTAKQFLEASL